MIADAGPTDGWLIAAFFGGLAPLLIWDARRFWRGPHKVWDGRPGAWDPFGPAYWHGFTRCVPLVAAFCSLGFVPLGLGEAIGGTAGDVLLVAGTLVSLLLVALAAGVFFFNRPRWCVPPHRRDEPGALAEFAAERRHRAQERRAARG
jgi:hypothetical protein